MHGLKRAASGERRRRPFEWMGTGFLLLTMLCVGVGCGSRSATVPTPVPYVQPTQEAVAPTPTSPGQGETGGESGDEQLAAGEVVHDTSVSRGQRSNVIPSTAMEKPRSRTQRACGLFGSVAGFV